MYHDIQRYNQLSSAEREIISRDEVPLKAATLHTSLNLIKNIFTFLKEQYIYSGLTENDIDAAKFSRRRWKVLLGVEPVEIVTDALERVCCLLRIKVRNAALDYLTLFHCIS